MFEIHKYISLFRGILGVQCVCTLKQQQKPHLFGINNTTKSRSHYRNSSSCSIVLGFGGLHTWIQTRSTSNCHVILGHLFYLIAPQFYLSGKTDVNTYSCNVAELNKMRQPTQKI